VKRFSITLLAILSLSGFFWPFLVPSQTMADKASWLFLACTPIMVSLIVLLVSEDQLSSKNIAFLGILSALIAALRPLGIGAIGIEPMWFALILAARVLGPTFGFLLGAISMTLSALLTGGIGPWLAYQIFAAALIGLGVGLIPERATGRVEIALLGFYGVLAAEFFGIAMDLQFWPWALGSGTELSYRAGDSIGENLSRFFQYHFLSALAWDIPRATITLTLILISGKPALNALRRARDKAAFASHAEFVELTDVRRGHR
jgi:energy-coupling factor transport system substrate-specific component